MTSTNDCNRNVSHSSNDCDLLVNVHIILFFFLNCYSFICCALCVLNNVFFFPILGISPSGPFCTFDGAHGASSLSSGSLLSLHF
jgi:hypothetical protein